MTVLKRIRRGYSKKAVMFGLLMVLVMLTIFLFSSQTGAASRAVSGRVAKLAAKVGFKFSVRKSAHIFLYFCLGTTASLFAGECLKTKKQPHSLRAALLSVLFCFLYSCSDEWHQTFVDGRAGQLRDVGIDAIGFLLGSAVILFWRLYTERRRQKS